MYKFIFCLMVCLSTTAYGNVLTSRQLDALSFVELDELTRNDSQQIIDRIRAAELLIGHDSHNKTGLNFLWEQAFSSFDIPNKALKILVKTPGLYGRYEQALAERLKVFQSGIYRVRALGLSLHAEPANKEVRAILRDIAIYNSDLEIKYKAIKALCKNAHLPDVENCQEFIPFLIQIFTHAYEEELKLKALCALMRLSKIYSTPHHDQYMPVLREKKLDSASESTRYKALTLLYSANKAKIKESALDSGRSESTQLRSKIIDFISKCYKSARRFTLLNLMYDDLPKYQRGDLQKMVWSWVDGLNPVLQKEALTFIAQHPDLRKQNEKLMADYEVFCTTNDPALFDAALRSLITTPLINLPRIRTAAFEKVKAAVLYDDFFLTTLLKNKTFTFFYLKEFFEKHVEFTENMSPDIHMRIAQNWGLSEHLDRFWGDESIRTRRMDHLLDLSLFAVKTAEDLAKIIGRDDITGDEHIQKIVDYAQRLINAESDMNKKAKWIAVLWNSPKICEHVADMKMAEAQTCEDNSKKLAAYRDVFEKIAPTKPQCEVAIANYVNILSVESNKHLDALTESLYNSWKVLFTEKIFNAHKDKILAAFLSYTGAASNAVKDKLFSFIWGLPFQDFPTNVRDVIVDYVTACAENLPQAHIWYLSLFYTDRLSQTGFNKIFPGVLRHASSTANVGLLFRLWSQKLLGFDQREVLALTMIEVLGMSRDLNFDYTKIVETIASEPAIAKKYRETLIENYKKFAKNFPSAHMVQFYGSVVFGESFEDEINSYILNYFDMLGYHAREPLIKEASTKFGEVHPLVQKLIYLSRTGSGLRASALYKQLLTRTNSKYVHRPSTLSDTILGRQFNFDIDERVFDYQPVGQKILATLDDVHSLLGSNPDADIKKAASSPVFVQYFSPPFSDEAMKAQALVKKYKSMPPAQGRDKMVALLVNLTTCGPGKNFALYHYYREESKPLILGNIKNITDVIAKLANTENPYLSDHEILEHFKKSRGDLITYLQSYMLGEKHIFRFHLSQNNDENSTRLKALIHVCARQGAPGADQSPQNEKLALVNMVNMLLSLGDPDQFFDNLNSLCQVYDIVLPANQYGDMLSETALMALINKLNPASVAGRGDFPALQQTMRDFIKNDDFVSLLENYQDEEGAKLRELVDGFVQNGWAEALLNLAELVTTGTLKQAVNMTYDRTRIDGDMELTWGSLKKVLLREVQRVKDQVVLTMVDQDKALNENEASHTHDYLKQMLGGAIGLRPATKMPNFDLYIYWTKKEALNKGLQPTLDNFHTHFMPMLITQFVRLLDEKKLSIADPKTGTNVIWHYLGLAAKEELKAHNIDPEIVDIDDLLISDNRTEIVKLCLALTLCKLGIFKWV